MNKLFSLTNSFWMLNLQMGNTKISLTKAEQDKINQLYYLYQQKHWDKLAFEELNKEISSWGNAHLNKVAFLKTVESTIAMMKCEYEKQVQLEALDYYS